MQAGRRAAWTAWKLATLATLAGGARAGPPPEAFGGVPELLMAERPPLRRARAVALPLLPGLVTA